MSDYEQLKKWRANNIETVREINNRSNRKNKAKRVVYMQRWRDEKRQTQPARVMIAHAKQRARKHNLEFNLSLEDIIIPEICPILGIPLYFTKGKSTENTPSLDRVDNNRGYIKENIRVISNKANALKRDMTIDDVKNLLKYMQGDNNEE